MLGHVFGKVHFLPQRLMLYRQHGSNVTGNISGSFTARLKRILSSQGHVLSRRHYDEKKAFFDAYQGELSDHARRTFLAYFSYPDKGLLGRLGVVLRHGFSIGGHQWALVLKTFLRKPIE
jgi:rhamnosyltransferase